MIENQFFLKYGLSMFAGFVMVWTLPFEKYNQTFDKWLRDYFECEIIYSRRNFHENYIKSNLKALYEFQDLKSKSSSNK